MPQENPPLLDKTMNTTEQTPRNLADVLAEGLEDIANNVKPDGSDISIDVPGMSANNVNDGFIELKGTLTNNTLLQPTEGTNVLLADGGYCKVGNIVVVNIRFKATANISAGSIIATNLPKPAYKNGMNYVQIYLSESKIGFIDSNGNLYLSVGVNLTQDEIVFAHTVYMTY